MQYHCGKSSLFPATPSALLEYLADPLILTVSLNDEIVGESEIVWKDKFLDMVKKCKENPGIRKPEYMKNTFSINEISTNKKMGDIKAYIRLSPFGNNIQTNFQLLGTQDAGHKFLVKGELGTTTFQCQK